MDRIEIETIDIESNIRSLMKAITRKNAASLIKNKDRKNFEKWIRELDAFQNKITNIRKIVLPKIQDDLTYPFSNCDLVLIAMVQPSTKNTFIDIKKHFSSETEWGISLKNLDYLENCSSTAQSLAWIGDTTIKYCFLREYWKPGISTQQLHNMREALEKDENLAKLCGHWSLFDHRIHLDPIVEKKDPLSKSEIEVRGTLTEALYGVIYIEKGIDEVQKAIHLINR